MVKYYTEFLLYFVISLNFSNGILLDNPGDIDGVIWTSDCNTIVDQNSEIGACLPGGFPLSSNRGFFTNCVTDGSCSISYKNQSPFTPSTISIKGIIFPNNHGAQISVSTDKTTNIHVIDDTGDNWDIDEIEIPSQDISPDMEIIIRIENVYNGLYLGVIDSIEIRSSSDPPPTDSTDPTIPTIPTTQTHPTIPTEPTIPIQTDPTIPTVSTIPTEITDPTVPTKQTTEPSEFEYKLGIKEDLNTFWDENCHYALDRDELLQLFQSCEFLQNIQDIEFPENDVGFWFPCNVSECRMIYSNSEIEITKFELNSYVKDDGHIIVYSESTSSNKKNYIKAQFVIDDSEWGNDIEDLPQTSKMLSFEISVVKGYPIFINEIIIRGIRTVIPPVPSSTSTPVDDADNDDDLPTWTIVWAGILSGLLIIGLFGLGIFYIVRRKRREEKAEILEEPNQMRFNSNPYPLVQSNGYSGQNNSNYNHNMQNYNRFNPNNQRNNDGWNIHS